MNFTSQGQIVFDDIYELYYQLFNEIGLSINQNQYLYDQESGIEIRFKDKFIKASVTPVPIYAGRNDILFEPNKNYALMISLLGYYLDKEASNENKIGYVAQYTDEHPQNKEYQRVVIKTNKGDIVSQYYRNIYLGYIECIFILSGNSVWLGNFDIVEE